MLKSNMRTTLAVLHDAAAAALAWSLAYLLRFNFDLPAGFAAELRQTRRSGIVQYRQRVTHI